MKFWRKPEDLARRLLGPKSSAASYRSTDIIRFFYRELFDREPEPDGLRNWAGRLDAGDDLQDVYRLLQNSAEARLRARTIAPAKGAQLRVDDAGDYAAWLKQHDYSPERDEPLLVARIADMTKRPVFSVVMADELDRSNPSAPASAKLARQVYSHWELLVPTASGTDARIMAFLAQRHARDSRVRAIPAPGDGFCHRMNAAFAEAKGEFVLVLRQRQELRPHALWLLAETLLSEPETDIIYFDEDRLTSDGQRHRPRFKAAWDPDRFLADPFVDEGAALRLSLVQALGGFRPEVAGSEHFDLLLRMTEKLPPARIRHLPFVLLSRQEEAEMPAESPANAQGARKALEDHFRRAGRPEVRVETRPEAPRRILWPVPRPRPAVSLIVPSRDQPALLRRCVESLRAIGDYDGLEIIIVDNDSVEPETRAYLAGLGEDRRVRILPHEGAFNFAAIVNRASAGARGSVLGLLNNDIEPLDDGWLDELVGQALRPEIGAVGALMWYPKGTVQHAGIVMGLEANSFHLYRDASAEDAGRIDELKLVRSVSAVTGACLFTRMSVFQEVGGLDEDLAVTYNDVDFCLAVAAQGYRVLWTPFAQLTHVESASRGPDEIRRARAAVARMRARWKTAVERDRFFSPNLALDPSGRLLAMPPRVDPPWHASATLPQTPRRSFLRPPR